MQDRTHMTRIEKYLELNRNGQADFHNHTNHCDGNNTAEEMVESAIAKGLKVFGFSEHGFTPYDDSYCMQPETEAAYEAEVRSLAEKYAGQIGILCGVEQDCLAGKPARGWDYVIGSVHYIDCSDKGGGILPIDESRELWLELVDRYFDGDVYAMIGRYYETEAMVCAKTGADLIGHFDLITKYNQGGEGGKPGALFDEGDPRYVAAWQKAVDILLEADVPFEINTGGMSRGYRTDAYPARPIRDYIASRGGRFMLSGDNHSTETICSRFEEYAPETMR